VRNHRGVALVESEAPLCPACATRSIDTVSGLCSVCVVDRAVTLYGERDRVAVHIRSVSWSARSAQPDATLVRLRQRRHRLREIVRPETPHRPERIRGRSVRRPYGRSAACGRRSHERRAASMTSSGRSSSCAGWRGDLTTEEPGVLAAI
jgi:hypothetical protein